MKNNTSALNYYKVLKTWKENREIWKDILGYEGLYQVSNMGEIYSYYKKDTMTPQNKKGYLIINLSRDGRGRSFYVHQLVARAFIPNPQKLATVNHKDFNKTNNDIKNLEWMSNIDNVRHAIANGRTARKDYAKIKARICSKCHTMKPMEEFRHRSLECRGCEKVRQNRYYVKNREKILNEYPAKIRYNSKFAKLIS